MTLRDSYKMDEIEDLDGEIGDKLQQSQRNHLSQASTTGKNVFEAYYGIDESRIEQAHTASKAARKPLHGGVKLEAIDHEVSK